jgi:hypothetical protein
VQNYALFLKSPNVSAFFSRFILKKVDFALKIALKERRDLINLL